MTKAILNVLDGCNNVSVCRVVAEDDTFDGFESACVELGRMHISTSKAPWAVSVPLCRGLRFIQKNDNKPASINCIK